MTFHYLAFGLHLASDLEMPELLPAVKEMPIDIEIREAELPREILDPAYQSDTQQIAPGIYQFLIPEVARYQVEAGQRILVDAAPNAHSGDVRLWILGTALGGLLHQRGLLPLHVSALVHDGQAVAFCGDSGAGKSTLAAALRRRGLTLLTDDVGLAVPESDQVTFYPGFPRIKLWRDALAHFDLDPDSLIRDLTRADKFHLTVDQGFDACPHPLRRLYVLDRAEDDQTRIEPLFGHAAIRAISHNTYRPELIRPLGMAADHLRQCGRMAQQIRVFRFVRPWQLARLDDSLDALLAHLDRQDHDSPAIRTAHG